MSVGCDQVVDMSVGYHRRLPCNCLCDGRNGKIEYNSKKEQSLGCHGFLWNQDDTAPLSVMNRLRKNDIAFFDRVRVGSNGETNSLDGVNSTERAAHLR